MRLHCSKCCIWIFAAFALAGISACDTERNIGDPDLHFFVKYYGGNGNQQGVDMLALNDGSFLLLGNSSTGDFDVNNLVYVVHVDGEGEVLWEGMYNEGSISRAIDIEPTKDGNFIVLCDIEDADSASQLMLLKISPDGDLLKSVVKGTIANDFSRSVTTLDDGSFVVSGTTELTGTYGDVNNPDPDLGDFLNYRFDQNLNILPGWGPAIVGFGGRVEVAVKLIQKPNQFYVFGYSNITLQDNNPLRRLGLSYFVRESDDGGQSLPNFLPNSGNVDTQIQFVHEVADELNGGFLVVGSSQNSVGSSEIFISKLKYDLTYNFNIDAVLNRTLPLNRNIRGTSGTSSLVAPLGYLIVGNEVRSTSATNIWLSKIDQSGTVLWSSTFGSEAGEDTAVAVHELPDGKIVILGTMGLADNQSKMAFIKLNPAGQLLK